MAWLLILFSLFALGSTPGVNALTPAMFESHRDPLNEDDDSPVLNAMFQFAVDNPIPGREIAWPDEYEVEQTVFVQGSQATHFVGSLVDTVGLEAVAHIDGSQSVFHGILRVDGLGSTPFATRKTVNGVVLRYVIRAKFDGFDVRSVRRNCVSTAGFGTVNQNLIDTDLGQVIGVDCGPGAGTQVGHVSRFDLPFTSRADSGAKTAVTQLSLLGVDLSENLGDVLPNDIAIISGEPYLVRFVDEVANTLSIFPQLADLAQVDGYIVFATGAALHIAGSSTTGLKAERVSAQRCGQGIDDRGLYAGSFGGLTTEVTGVGLRVGNEGSAAHLGGFFGQLHIESTVWHLLKVLRIDAPMTVGSFVIFEPTKMKGLTTHTGNEQWGQLGGMTLIHSAVFDTARSHLPINKSANTKIIGNTPGQNEGVFMVNNPTFTVDWVEDHDRLFAHNSLKVLLAGPTGGSPGTAVFGLHSSDVGDTINGFVPPVSLSLTGPAEVVMVRDVSANNWILLSHPLN